jgi:hypothetical protein
MRVLVTMQRHADAAALIDDVRSVGYKIQAAKPVGEYCTAWRSWGGNRAPLLWTAAVCGLR